MPAARFWRLVAFDAYAGGDLALSEAALFEGATRVDGAATLSATIAPSSGALSSLSDSSFGTSAQWVGSLVRSSGFALVWDFGTGVTKEITKVGLASPLRNTAAALASLEYSEDGLSWSALGVAAFKYVNPSSFAESSAFDPHFDKVTLLLHCNGEEGGMSFLDSSLAKRHPDVIGVSTSTVIKKQGNASAYFHGDQFARFLRFPSVNDFKFGFSDFTIEMWVYANRTAQLSAYPRMLCKGTYAEPGSFAFVLIKETGDIFFDFYGSSVIGLYGGTLPNDEWTHVRVSRVGGMAYLFKNGILQSSASANVNINKSSELFIGTEIANISKFVGFLDDIRITEGLGRSTTNFTPPALEHPDGHIPSDLPVRTTGSQSTLIGGGIEGVTQSAISAQPSHLDIYDAGRGRIVGTVKEKNTPTNTPLKRRVVLLSMPGSRAIRETWSDPVTGAYEFTEVAMDRVYTAVSYDHTGIYRGVVADNLTPGLMP